MNRGGVRKEWCRGQKSERNVTHPPTVSEYAPQVNDGVNARLYTDVEGFLNDARFPFFLLCVSVLGKSVRVDNAGHGIW